MPLEERPHPQEISNEELLTQAERFATWARNLYHHDDKSASTAAQVSLAGSALVIARILMAQAEARNDGNLPDMPAPGDWPTELEGE